MFLKKSILALSVSSVILGLTACGGASSQDSGSAGSSVKLSGLVVDPYLARALVYVDVNNNGQLDNFESYALTDDDGRFSYNDITKKDYCSGVDADARYCLKSPQTSKNAVLRIQGGYDAYTGEPFVGSMSMKLNLDEGKTNVGTANPLTSLITNTTPEQLQYFLDYSGLSKSQLNEDFLSSSTYSSKAFQNALQLQKAASVLTTAIEKELPKIKPNRDGYPFSAAPYVYKYIAIFLATTPAHGMTPVQKDFWTNVYINAYRELGAIEGVDGAALIDQNEVNIISDTAATLFKWIGEVKLPTAYVGSNTTEGENPALAAVARVADVVVAKVSKQVISGTVIADATVDELLTAVGKDATDSSSGLAAIGKNVNLNDLATAKVGDVTLAKLTSNSYQYDPTAKVSSVGGQTLTLEAFEKTGTSITYLNKDGSTTTDSSGGRIKEAEQGVIKFFFGGDTASTNGNLSACLRYSGNKNTSNSSDVDTDGVLLKGGWSKLGDYSVLLNLEFAGSQKSFIIKSLGETKPLSQKGLDKNANNIGWNYQFDLKGTLAEWPSVDGFVANTDFNLPTNDAWCQDHVTLPQSSKF